MTAPQFALPLEKPSDPDWLTSPKSEIECKFKLFHTRNPDVYMRLEIAALQWERSGAKRIGVKRLVENLRYSSIELDRRFWQEFKIDDRHTCLYARLLVHRHPSLSVFIEVRRRREDGASVE